MNDLPWLSARNLNDNEWLKTRERAIFACFKWDQQVGDTATLAGQPIILRTETWTQLAAWAEALAGECTLAEEELCQRPGLHAALGFRGSVRRDLRLAHRSGPSRSIARLIRFDFHFTTAGWRISEGNTDVPGGHNEADGYADLFRGFYDGAVPLGTSPVSALAEALL